jgi:hypothetical protein
MTNLSKTILPTSGDQLDADFNQDAIYYPTGIDKGLARELLHYMDGKDSDAILAKIDCHLAQQVVDQKFINAKKLQLKANKAMNDAKQAASIAAKEQAWRT